MPDPNVVARTALGDIEARMGIPLLEELLAERDGLVQQVAALRARHAAWGTYGDLRKIELCKIAAALRGTAVAAGVKMTEAAIDEAAHADSRYIQFVTTATEEKTAWVLLEDRIQGIADTIQRANAIARFLAAEAHL